MIKNFLEYMNSKKKIEKPKIKVLADEVDVPKDKAKKPPKAKGMTDGMQPYVKEGNKAPKTTTKGFGDIDGANGVHYDVTKNKTPAKLPVAESCFEIVPILRETAKDDPRTVELLVNEFKKHGLLGMLVGELLTHKETYREMAGVMGNERYGQDVCNRLASAIREVSEPYHDEMEASGEMPPEEGEVDPNADPMADPNDPNAETDDDFDPEAHIFGDDEDGEEVDPNDPDAMLDDESDPMADPNDPNAIPPEEGEPQFDDQGNPIPPQGQLGQGVPPPALEHLNRAMRNIIR